MQRHPSVAQNRDVQELMDEFAKLVGPTSDIHKNEKMKLGISQKKKKIMQIYKKN